jgi:hypothetical protein
VFLFLFANFQTAANWNNVSIPVVTDASFAFSSINLLGPLPALNPVSVIDATSMFSLSTFTAAPQSHLWTFPSLQLAVSTFLGTNFGNFAFRTDTWGMGAVISLLNTFNAALNVPTTIDVSNWNVANLVTFSGFAYGINNTALLFDLSTWNTPSLVNIPSAFANTANVKFAGINHLNVANVVDATAVFFDAYTTNNNITSWDTSNLILGDFAFGRIISNVLDVSGLLTPQLTLMNSMFVDSNMNPDLTNWNMTSVVDPNNALQHCYITKTRYDQVLIAFNNRTALNGKNLGIPQTNPLISPIDPANVPQGYSVVGQPAHDGLIARGWTIVDGGLQ